MTAAHTQMRGMTVVRKAVAKYLKDAYPIMRQRSLASWGVSGVEIPEITVYNPFDLIGMSTNDKPQLGVEGRRAQGFRRTDTVNGEDEFRATYSVVVGISLYSPDDTTGTAVDQARLKVTRQRDDMLAILRQCLLTRPTLGTGDVLYVVEESVVEEYNQVVPTPNNSQRYFATGSLVFDLKVDEYLLHPPLNDPTKPNIFDVQVEVTTLTDELHTHVDKLP